MKTLLTLWPNAGEDLDGSSGAGNPIAVYLSAIRQITITPPGKPTVIIIGPPTLDTLRAAFHDQPEEQ